MITAYTIEIITDDIKTPILYVGIISIVATLKTLMAPKEIIKEYITPSVGLLKVFAGRIK
jgi:hypothetical protein